MTTAVELAAQVAEEATRTAAQEVPLALLSSVAHELRTPLAALAASAEMLEVAEDAEDRRRFASIIQRQAQRLNSIVEGLLEAYRSTREDSPAIDEIVDLGRLFDDLIVEQRLLYPQHCFVAEFPRETRVLSRTRTLHMILANLLSNAAKYSSAGSTVRLSCRSDGMRTEIRVRDYGRGVPLHLRERIFEAGERGLQCGDTGYGLGLFIARRLCHAIGADLRLDEPGDRKGSAFVVTLWRERGAS